VTPRWRNGARETEDLNQSGKIADWLAQAELAGRAAGISMKTQSETDIGLETSWACTAGLTWKGGPAKKRALLGKRLTAATSERKNVEKTMAGAADVAEK